MKGDPSRTKENTEGDNPPIGIVLAKEKDELVVQYAMHNISSQLFVQKYQLYLPEKEELRKLIINELNRELYMKELDFQDKIFSQKDKGYAFVASDNTMQRRCYKNTCKSRKLNYLREIL